MNSLTVFGLIAVTLMLVFYAMEDRSPHFILTFAFACWLGAAYGFLQGAGVWNGGCGTGTEANAINLSRNCLP
jgi:uncharacterized membrane-anchored protein